MVCKFFASVLPLKLTKTSYLHSQVEEEEEDDTLYFHPRVEEEGDDD